jgi:serine/threonine protein kinase
MRYFLKVKTDKEDPKTIGLPGSGRVVLGRGSATDIRIIDPETSRKHCQIDLTDQGISIKDLGSHNGTFVNGKEVLEGRIIKPGDEIEIGNTHISLGCTGTDKPVPERAGTQGPGMLHCLSCGRSANGPCPRCGPAYMTPPDGIPGLRLLKRLGAGAMGVVFKAHQVKENRPVALKVMAFQGDPPEADLQRFIREANIPAKLKHENIVAVLGSGGLRVKTPHELLEAGQVPAKAGFIILEYVEGRDLEKILKDEGPRPVDEAVRIACCVADALTMAGGEGIVHRDIKPQNIMITGDGTVKVMDFGLAKSFEEAGLSGITAAGAAMGTPQFMPPEQIEDAVYADHRADIYSLGATLYYILTGTTPFSGKKVREILEKVVNEAPPKLKDVLPGLPKTLSRIVFKCMRKDPAKRYQTADHLWEELTQVMNGLE